jgi:plastocyanin
MMRRRRTISLLSSVFCLVVALSLPRLSSPAFGQQELVALAASGLTNPRGFTWDADGALIIAEAGKAGGSEASGEIEIPAPTGPYKGGATASVVKAVGGCVTTVADKLPSAQSASGEVIGVADVAFLGDTLYALVTGGGAAHGNPGQPNGIYTVGADGVSELLVDLGQWLRENPVEKPPENDFDPEGSFFSMTADAKLDALWVVESNSEQILSVTATGDVTRIADLSSDNAVPTAIVPAPDGGVYVGELTSAPFTQGSARILHVTIDGTTSSVWSGLTAVTGLALDSNGTLYAAQLSTTRDRPPYLEPATGSIVRQSGESSFEVVAAGLNFPVSLEFGPDNALYVSLPAIGANDGTGSIIQIVPGDTPLSIDTASLAQHTCGDGTGGVNVGSGSSSGPSSEGDGTGADNAESETPSPAASEVVVRIYDFGFDNPTLTIPAGTSVTWANTGAVQHTTVATVNGEKYWDSGIMEPGATFSFTFNEAGTWDYVCGLHPDMKGTIIVQ